MTDNKFCGNDSFEEWAKKQDKNSLEYLAIESCHKTHPRFELEEIKNYIFMNTIETENNQKLCLESFSARHINSNKLNMQMSKLCRIIFSTSTEYNSVDKRGHGDTVTTRIGGRGKEAEVIAFRIEEKAIRHAHFLIEHSLVSHQTISDMVRAGFVRYMEMLPIVNEIRDAVTNRFLLDVQIERENLEKLRVDEMLKGFEAKLITEEDGMMESLRHMNSKEELEELRNWTVNFIKEVLSYNGPTKREVGRVREYIMRNSRLFNILTTLERNGLVTSEYIDNVRTKGIHTESLDLIFDEENKNK